MGQLLMLGGLTGFAVSQPLLSVAGESPATFAFRSVEGLQLVVFALVIAFVPPLVLWAVLRLIALISRQASDLAFVAVAGLLAAAAGIQIAKTLDIEGPGLVAAAGLLVGALLVVAYLRVRSVDLWLRVSAILPVGAVLLFLFASPTGALLSPRSAGPSRVDAAGAPPVVFIMLDEFPTQSLLDDDRNIDAERFPVLASMAERFTWYRDYTVPSNQTLVSVPSILSGTVPTSGAATAVDYPNSLFTLLAPTHDLHVFESATKVCALEACTSSTAAAAGASGALGALREMPAVWSQRLSLDASSPTVDMGEFAEKVESAEMGSADSVPPGSGGSDNPFTRLQRKIESTPARVVDFTDSFTDRGSHPGLYFLHLLLPHQPWNFYPDGSRYVASPVNLDPTEAARALLEQRHLFQAQYADRLVGEMLASLEAAGIYDEAMIIVTADHGISFDIVPNGRTLSSDTLSEVAYAPLFIKNPGQQVGGVDDANVTGTDLLPTIAEVTGIAPTWETVGAPMASNDVASRGPEKVIYDFGGAWDPKPRTSVTFADSDRPDASKRLIRSLGPDASPIGGLVDRFGAKDMLGMRLSDLSLELGTELVTLVDGTDQGTAQGGLPLPTILGTVSGTAQEGDVVLVALDDTVVTAGPLIAGTFEALWPPGTSTQDRSRLELVLSRNGTMSRLTIN
jgi:hypothetical protein